MQEELGRPIDEVYSEITPEPVAAASLGQASGACAQGDSRATVAAAASPAASRAAASAAARALAQPAVFVVAALQHMAATCKAVGNRLTGLTATSHPLFSLLWSATQVYKARLRSTGEQVAVKVQRPGIGENIAIDMVLLRRLVAVIDDNIPQVLGCCWSCC